MFILPSMYLFNAAKAIDAALPSPWTAKVNSDKNWIVVSEDADLQTLVMTVHFDGDSAIVNFSCWSEWKCSPEDELVADALEAMLAYVIQRAVGLTVPRVIT